MILDFLPIFEKKDLVKRCILAKVMKDSAIQGLTWALKHAIIRGFEFRKSIFHFFGKIYIPSDSSPRAESIGGKITVLA